MTVGTLPLVAASLLAREEWRLPATPATWAAFGYLTLIGSVVVFYLYVFVLGRWTASTTSYSFLLIPAATVIIAAWLAGEAITLAFVLGGIIVLAGVWLGAIRRSPEVAELTCSATPSKAIC